jgi:hypothetical protein
MYADVARYGLRWQVEAAGIEMGELTFIKGGLATTIHDDGSTSTTPVDKCDYCGEWVSQLGGLTIRDIGLEVVTWLCAQCRA